MIITLTGENDFASTAELNKLITKFVTEHSDVALERIDANEVDYQQIYDALTSLPFLASKKMVLLRSPSANKDFADKAEELIKNLPESTDLVVVEPKFDKRSGLYKLLKKITDFREFDQLDQTSLARWLVDKAKQQKSSISLVDAQFLIDRVGTNQQMLVNELNKLMLYDATITRTTIEQMTEQTPQSTIFELLDAAFAGNSKQAVELYVEQRAMKVEPQQIIAMLTWQFHILALIKAAGDRTPDQIANEAKINPFVVRKSLNIARRLNLDKLKKLINNLLILDKRLKNESIDADEALQNYLITLSYDE